MISVVVNTQSIKPIDLLDCMDSLEIYIKNSKIYRLPWNKIGTLS